MKPLTDEGLRRKRWRKELKRRLVIRHRLKYFGSKSVPLQAKDQKKEPVKISPKTISRWQRILQWVKKLWRQV